MLLNNSSIESFNSWGNGLEIKTGIKNHTNSTKKYVKNEKNVKLAYNVNKMVSLHSAEIVRSMLLL